MKHGSLNFIIRQYPLRQVNHTEWLKNARITDALKLGEVQIFSLDPFADINPLTEPPTMKSVSQRIVYEKEFAPMGLLTGNDGTSRSNDNYDDEWIMHERRRLTLHKKYFWHFYWQGWGYVNVYMTLYFNQNMLLHIH